MPLMEAAVGWWVVVPDSELEVMTSVGPLIGSVKRDCLRRVS